MSNNPNKESPPTYPCQGVRYINPDYLPPPLPREQQAAQEAAAQHAADSRFGRLKNWTSEILHRSGVAYSEQKQYL